MAKSPANRRPAKRRTAKQAAAAGKHKSKTKPRPKGWRLAATYLIDDIKRGWRFRKDYSARRGLDPTAAIARLDKELARCRIPYAARYLGMRDGHATFRITVTSKYGFRMWDAVDRV
jgi:hypothetical protein